jgi:hypothetical protein
MFPPFLFLFSSVPRLEVRVGGSFTKYTAIYGYIDIHLQELHFRGFVISSSGYNREEGRREKTS